jgi:hypothetical protein
LKAKTWVITVQDKKIDEATIETVLISVSELPCHVNSNIMGNDGCIKGRHFRTNIHTTMTKNTIAAPLAKLIEASCKPKAE